jgi:hypothetical protein
MRSINLAEDFYQGLLEIQTYASAHGGQGRQLVNAIMDFAYQIVGSAPQAYPVLPVPQQPTVEFRRAIFRKRYILIYQVTATELLFLLVYSAKQLPPTIPTVS